MWKYVCKDQHFWNLVHKKYIVPVCVDRKFETKLKENKKDIINKGRSNCQQLSLSIVVSFLLLINFQLSPTQSSLVTRKMGKVYIFESLWTLGVLVWKFCCMVWKLKLLQLLYLRSFLWMYPWNALERAIFSFLTWICYSLGFIKWPFWLWKSLEKVEFQYFKIVGTLSLYPKLKSINDNLSVVPGLTIIVLCYGNHC